ncbi:MAG: alpha/beta fold hydrolase [Armatimonadetes bacterium]|nr:alpha/beta fold hydrolase [Armatimonadota bacterium]
MTTRIQDVVIPSPAGSLEGVLNVPDSGSGRVAVFCHPHPLYGGSMHSHVVYHAARALREAGYVVLRFNFRGVGRSSGQWDEGRGEPEDVRAAIDFLLEQYPDAPLLVGGYSFGGWAALRVADPRACGTLAVGMPVATHDFGFLREAAHPLAVIQGGGDPHGDVAQVRTLMESLPVPARLEEIPEAGHFFPTHLDALRRAVQACAAWLEDACPLKKSG